MHHRTSNFAPLQRFVAAFFAWLVAAAAALQAQEESSFAGKVVVLQIAEHTLVEAAQIDHLQAGLEQARADGAAAVVLELESPGGFAIATRRVIEKLGEMDGVKTFAFVKGETAGGPALIALATDGIYFSAQGVLGSAQDKTIDWRGARSAIPDRLVEKTYADFAEAMKRVVVAKGRDSLLVDGFIDPGIEVRLGDELLSEKDDVLVLGAGSPVAAGDAQTVGELCTAAGLAGEIVTSNYTAKQLAEDVGVEPPVDAPVGEVEEEVPFGMIAEDSYRGKIVVIEIGKWTLMRKTKFDFMKRILLKAEEDGAEAVIFEMNTPGGQLFATEEIMIALQDLKIPTYTFVNVAASSAGSLIAIATDKIYMHRPSTIGSAAIVSSTGEIGEKMLEKIESKFLDTVAEIAEAKGYDPELCKTFVKMELEYFVSIPVVESDGSLSSRVVFSVKEGELLSFSSTEATQMVDGKPLLATGTVQTIEELVEKEGLRGEVVRAKPMGFENVADFIVMLAPVLLLLALAGIYIEVNTPGFGFPGAAALCLLAIFFFGHQAAGKLAGYEVIAVFLLGIALLVVELFILPGVFIFGALGLLLIIGSLLFAMVDKFDFNEVGGEFDFERLLGGLGTPITNLIIALAGAVVLVVVLMRYLPEIPLMKKRMLVGVSSGRMRTLRQVSGSKVSASAPELIGLEGTAQCDLRPSGKGMFGGRLLDVTAESVFVAQGTRIRVVKEEGAQIVVEELS